MSKTTGEGGVHDDEPARDSFLERVAEPMRAEEHLDVGFEDRVMNAVYAARASFDGTHDSVSEAAVQVTPPVMPPVPTPVTAGVASHSARDKILRAQDASPRRAVPGWTSFAWWRTPRSVLLSPISVVGGAAALVAIVLASGAVRRAGAPVMSPSTVVRTVSRMAPDTVHVLRFVLMDTSAHSVSVVGDFNGWDKTATPLAATRPGVWSTSVVLPPGRHEYAFIVHRDSGDRWVLDPAAGVARDEFSTESSVVLVGDSRAAVVRAL